MPQPSSPICDLTKVLADSQTLTDIAIACGITIAQARSVAARIGELPAEQAVRICGIAARDLLRRKNREARK